MTGMCRGGCVVLDVLRLGTPSLTLDVGATGAPRVTRSPHHVAVSSPGP